MRKLSRDALVASSNQPPPHTHTHVTLLRSGKAAKVAVMVMKVDATIMNLLPVGQINRLLAQQTVAQFQTSVNMGGHCPSGWYFAIKSRSSLAQEMNNCSSSKVTAPESQLLKGTLGAPWSTLPLAQGKNFLYNNHCVNCPHLNTFSRSNPFLTLKEAALLPFSYIWN